MQLAHQRAGEGVAAVHRHDDGAGVRGAEQSGDGLQEAGGEAGLLDVTLLGSHQLLGQGLLQGQGQLAGRGAGPAGVCLQGEDLGGGGGEWRKIDQPKTTDRTQMGGGGVELAYPKNVSPLLNRPKGKSH